MILVDEAKFQRGSQMWCHMMSDLPDQQQAIRELHTFAQRIGLRRSWYQPRSSPHYDLSPRYRTAALLAGAEAVTSKELVRRCVRRSQREEAGR
jgi:hypothetical protein